MPTPSFSFLFGKSIEQTKIGFEGQMFMGIHLGSEEGLGRYFNKTDILIKLNIKLKHNCS